jgi:hypothetical protein
MAKGRHARFSFLHRWAWGPAKCIHFAGSGAYSVLPEQVEKQWVESKTRTASWIAGEHRQAVCWHRYCANTTWQFTRLLQVPSVKYWPLSLQLRSDANCVVLNGPPNSHVKMGLSSHVKMGLTRT